MNLSKERLLLLSEETGFRSEILEKVILLMDLLSVISENSKLKDQFVLKGGTALNLFYLACHDSRSTLI
jgi:predicted nucleotidyltransferase component of viral defense system